MSSGDYTGRTLDGKYHLTNLLGKGGMGSVYRGEHIIIGKKVAVKFLHSEFARNEEVVKRFYREAQAAASIGHSSIIDILDVGVSPEGEPYLVMEYLEGESLGDMLARTGPLDTGAACGILEPSLQALQAAHNAGIVHRDLKPDNIFIVRQPSGPPKIKLIDFGISKFVEGGGGEKLTQTGSVMGTPAYMSPEQARGSTSLDYRADLYSMGVIFYEMLTGKLPFKGSNFTEIIISILTEHPIPPREAYEGFPAQAEAVLMKALAKDPAERPQTAAEFIEALKLLQGYSVRQDNLTRVAATAEHVTFAGGNLGDSAKDSTKDSGQLAANVLSQVAKRQGTPAGWSNTNIATRRSNAKIFVAVGAIAALITAGGVIAAVVLSGGSSPAVVPVVPVAAVQAAPESVTIEVSGAPSGARVFFDDMLVTVNPFKVKRTETSALLRVELEGFEPFVASVAPRIDQKVVVSMNPRMALDLASDAEESGGGSSKRKSSKGKKGKADQEQPAVAAPAPTPPPVPAAPPPAPQPDPENEAQKAAKKKTSLQKGAKGTKMADTFE